MSILNTNGLTKTAEFRYKRQERLLEQVGNQNVIKAYFPEVSLANGFQGLTAIAKKKGFDVEKLKKGEMLLFTNRAKTACKLIVAGNVLLYQKAPGDSRLIYSAILALPRFLNGSELNLKGAIKAAVIKDHEQRNWKRTGVYKPIVVPADPAPHLANVTTSQAV